MSLLRPLPVCAVLLALGASACGSVEVPEEHLYRLAYPAPPEQQDPLPMALRVERLELAAHLAGDRLMVGSGPVEMRPYHYHRWAGPLELLVGDALLTGLVRSRAFSSVKGPADPGSAELLLSGRVLELHHVLGPGGGEARVTLDLQLVDARDREVLFRDEFRAAVDLSDTAPDTLVRGLSRGLSEVVTSVVLRARTTGAGDTADLAEPPGRGR